MPVARGGVDPHEQTFILVFRRWLPSVTRAYFVLVKRLETSDLSRKSREEDFILEALKMPRLQCSTGTQYYGFSGREVKRLPKCVSVPFSTKHKSIATYVACARVQASHTHLLRWYASMRLETCDRDETNDARLACTIGASRQADI